MGLKVTETTYRGGGSSSRSTKDRKAKRTFIVEYDADSPPASLAAVETANDGVAAIPALASTLSGDTSRKVSNISVKPRDDTGLLFDVEVDYTTAEPGTVGENPDNPLSAPVDYEWDFSLSSRPYFLDCSDTPQPTATSAGEPFQNLLEREEGEVVVTITKNIAPEAWTPIAAAQYGKPATAINSDTISVDGVSIAAGQARWGGCKVGPRRTLNGIQYRTRTLVLRLAESWDQEVEDRGFHEVDPDNAGKLREIVKGTPPTKVETPWPLDGSGAAETNADDEPATLEFKPYPAKAFAGWL